MAAVVVTWEEEEVEVTIILEAIASAKDLVRNPVSSK